jgi:glycosyltransferase involved in cell wall biosynthesis
MNELVFILPNSEGGVASIVYNLIRFNSHNSRTKVILLECGHEVLLNRKFVCDEVVNIKIEKNRSVYHNCKKIKEHISHQSIIISNDGGLELDMVKLFKLPNPVIYILHGDYRYYYNMIKQKHHVINSIITYSEYMLLNANEILSSFAIKPSAKKIYYPVPHIKIKEQRIDGLLKIIYASTLVEQKGVHLFPEIISQLVSRDINFQFTVVGNGPLMNLVEDLQKQYPQVKYEGQLNNEQVINIMRQHDIFFLPTFSEGLPVSIIEAMKAGLVTVTSNIKSGIPEVIFDGETGFKIEPGNIEGYVNAIQRLSENRAELNRLSSKASSFANTNFDPEKQTANYINTFLMAEKYVREIKPLKPLEKMEYMLPDRLRLLFEFKIKRFFAKIES